MAVRRRALVAARRARRGGYPSGQSPRPGPDHGRDRPRTAPARRPPARRSAEAAGRDRRPPAGPASASSSQGCLSPLATAFPGPMRTTPARGRYVPPAGRRVPNASTSSPSGPARRVCVCSSIRWTRQSPSPTSHVSPSCQEMPRAAKHVVDLLLGELDVGGGRPLARVYLDAVDAERHRAGGHAEVAPRTAEMAVFPDFGLGLVPVRHGHGGHHATFSGGKLQPKSQFAPRRASESGAPGSNPSASTGSTRGPPRAPPRARRTGRAPMRPGEGRPPSSTRRPASRGRSPSNAGTSRQARPDR